VRVVGISEGYHDAGYCVLDGDEITHASHSERYSRVKNDPFIHVEQILENVQNVNDTVAYYEKPFWKNLRRLYAGQGWEKVRTKYDVSFGHHQSHAAAGYYTAPFDDCNILVIDAIGEWDTITIWDNMKKIKSWKYPYSLGLLYSAITQRLGLKPNEHEYITMGMAAFGEPLHDLEHLLYQNNHMGVGDILPMVKRVDLAASVQALYEKKFLELVDMCPKKNLILMGGCALNCVANSKIKDKNIWIMPSPGDSGSSLGAAALVYKKKVKWKHPYLGYNISRDVNPKDVVKELLKNQLCGVANGRAEFGPRALGNRSLLGDPRYDIKDTVNKIKQREMFRPFAPAILEEYADDYFDGPMNRYMQFVANAKHDHKSVTHVDGTARVQLVEKDNVSILRPILEEWYEQTGCPMLLNTSLNIKGQPIVNTWEDAKEFERKYNVPVF
tara:strand:+ start:798 stop:2123 length:1326 start_codon:yes stop_codon:yes gene_type:complete